MMFVKEIWFLSKWFKKRLDTKFGKHEPFATLIPNRDMSWFYDRKFRIILSSLGVLVECRRKIVIYPPKQIPIWKMKSFLMDDITSLWCKLQVQLIVAIENSWIFGKKLFWEGIIDWKIDFVPWNFVVWRTCWFVICCHEKDDMINCNKKHQCKLYCTHHQLILKAKE